MMNIWDYILSTLFTFACLGFYFGFLLLPNMVENGTISESVAAILIPIIIGLSIGSASSTLYKFFYDVTGIKNALKDRR